MGCHTKFVRFSGEHWGNDDTTSDGQGTIELVLSQTLVSTLILIFAVAPLGMWETRLSSDSRSPRARHRFGFSGPVTRQKKGRVTPDDILDSLTRQAELRQKLGKNDSLRLDDIAGREEISWLQGFSPEPALPSTMAKKRSFGHLAFVFMLLTGLTIVWLYSSILKPFDLASLNGIIQKTGVQSVFANEAKVGILALIALAGALWIYRRRRPSSVPFLSTQVS